MPDTRADGDKERSMITGLTSVELHKLIKSGAIKVRMDSINVDKVKHAAGMRKRRADNPEHYRAKQREYSRRFRANQKKGLDRIPAEIAMQRSAA
jgi:hypothetical protein